MGADPGGVAEGQGGCAWPGHKDFHHAWSRGDCRRGEDNHGGAAGCGSGLPHTRTIHAANQAPSQGEGVCDADSVCSPGGRRQGAGLPLHRLRASRQEQLQGGRVLYQEYSGRAEKSICKCCLKLYVEWLNIYQINNPFHEQELVYLNTENLYQQMKIVFTIITIR